MQRICIAVVDASRARLWTYQRTNEPGGLEETFVEQRDLVHPGRRLPDTDSHNDAQDVEFAHLVMREIAALLREFATTRLVVCAPPRMLGHLRDARRDLPRDLAVEELARDLVKLSAPQLRDHLAEHDLVPPRLRVRT